MTRRNKYTGRFVGGDLLTALCKAEKLPLPVREYRFAPPRRWRADYCWPDQKVILEIEGGVFGAAGSRHNRGAGFRADCEKYNFAAILGYRILRYLPEQVKARAIDDLRPMLCPRKGLNDGPRIGSYPVIEAT